MGDKATGKVKLPPLGQIGVVVKDIDKAIEYYSSVFGIGPWRVVEINCPEVEVCGKTYSWRAKLAFTKLGPIELELMQNLDGRSIHSEFLEKGREGLHHLGFFVSGEEKDDILAKLAEEGIEVLQGGKRPSGKGSYAYLDTQKIGGVMFELIHRPSKQEVSEPWESDRRLDSFRDGHQRRQ